MYLYLGAEQQPFAVIDSKSSLNKIQAPSLVMTELKEAPGETVSNYQARILASVLFKPRPRPRWFISPSGKVVKALASRRRQSTSPTISWWAIALNWTWLCHHLASMPTHTRTTSAWVASHKTRVNKSAWPWTATWTPTSCLISQWHNLVTHINYNHKKGCPTFPVDLSVA